jgi:D-alanyl-D-alanine carboxypeptidase (penicillin-binding protein 5/6)
MNELNVYLQKLGCKNTHFVNPHGYHHPDHVTTAQDLSLIARKVLQNPVLRTIVSKTSYTKPKTNKQPSVELVQSNALLKPGKHYYSKAIGLKTGFHSAGRSNLAAAAEHQGRTLVAIVLGCEKHAERFADAKRLFEAAFSEVPVSRVVVPLGTQYQTSVLGADRALQGSVSQNLVVTYYPSEEPEIKAYLAWDAVTLPVQKGQRVGELRAVDGRGVVVRVAPVTAAQDVSPTLWFRFSSWWGRLFGRG